MHGVIAFILRAVGVMAYITFILLENFKHHITENFQSQLITNGARYVLVAKFVDICLGASYQPTLLRNSPVVSTIVTVVIRGLPRLTLFGSELLTIVSVKDSSPSCIVSFIIGILKVTLVLPAINMTSYSPEI